MGYVEVTPERFARDRKALCHIVTGLHHIPLTAAGLIVRSGIQFCVVRIAIASDHGGFELKEALKTLLDELHIPYKDFGTTSTDAVDYPDYAEVVGRKVAAGEFDRGILACGTGIGMSIAANKIPGIRAALVWNVITARLAREHNDANIMTVGGRTTSIELAREIVRTFLTTAFDGDGRHARRVQEISSLDCKDS